MISISVAMGLSGTENKVGDRPRAKPQRFGNVREIKELLEGCRRGGNHNAYFGGLRMWEDHGDTTTPKLAVLPQVEPQSA